MSFHSHVGKFLGDLEHSCFKEANWARSLCKHKLDSMPKWSGTCFVSYCSVYLAGLVMTEKSFTDEKCYKNSNLSYTAQKTLWAPDSTLDGNLTTSPFSWKSRFYVLTWIPQTLLLLRDAMWLFCRIQCCVSPLCLTVPNSTVFWFLLLDELFGVFIAAESRGRQRGRLKALEVSEVNS